LFLPKNDGVVFSAQTWDVHAQTWFTLRGEGEPGAQSREKKAQKTFDGVQKESPAI